MLRYLTSKDLADWSGDLIRFNPGDEMTLKSNLYTPKTWGHATTATTGEYVAKTGDWKTNSAKIENNAFNLTASLVASAALLTASMF